MADGVEKPAGSPRLRMIWCVLRGISAGDSAMMGRQKDDQSQFQEGATMSKCSTR